MNAQARCPSARGSPRQRPATRRARTLSRWRWRMLPTGTTLKCPRRRTPPFAPRRPPRVSGRCRPCPPRSPLAPSVAARARTATAGARRPARAAAVARGRFRCRRLPQCPSRRTCRCCPRVQRAAPSASTGPMPRSATATRRRLSTGTVTGPYRRAGRATARMYPPLGLRAPRGRRAAARRGAGRTAWSTSRTRCARRAASTNPPLGLRAPRGRRAAARRGAGRTAWSTS